jgi:hypothetical protein
MTREQCLKIVEKEIQAINKKIDVKILKGEAYFREAREHKLLLRKARQFSPKSFWSKLFSFSFSHA